MIILETIIVLWYIIFVYPHVFLDFKIDLFRTTWLVLGLNLERVPERIDDIDFNYNYTRGSQL